MDFKKIAREILANVGNEENIKDVIHCHTRLRFSLIDSDKVNKDNLSKIEGVITVVESMDQLQVVIGSNVDKVYKELEKMLGKTTDVSNNEVLKNEKTKGNSFNKALTTMAQIFTPTYICTSWFWYDKRYTSCCINVLFKCSQYRYKAK